MRLLSPSLAVAFLFLPIGAAPSLAQSGGDELDALLAEEARTATELRQAEQSRQEIELQVSQFVQRVEAGAAERRVVNNEIDQWNATCAREVDEATYQRCMGWRSGIEARQAVSNETEARLRREEDALARRDEERVARARAALGSLARVAVRIEMVCSGMAAEQRPARCRRINFDPMIAEVMALMQGAARERYQRCHLLGTPEAVAECARAPFDLSGFRPAMPTQAPQGARVVRR